MAYLESPWNTSEFQGLLVVPHPLAITQMGPQTPQNDKTMNDQRLGCAAAELGNWVRVGGHLARAMRICHPPLKLVQLRS